MPCALQSRCAKHAIKVLPPHRKLLLTLLIQIKEKFFFKKRTLFNETPDPQTPYFSKIGPENSTHHLVKYHSENDLTQ